MGLIDLKTDLKSLKYGKDTIGGGYSGQPYIQTPIPDSFNDLGANEDFILRGGVNAARDTANDIKRLTKMFFDLKSPNGVLFIAKQNLLSQTSVRTQTTNGVNEGIYTPLNTLAQVGVVNTGGHLNKQGLNPFAETGAYSNNDALYSVKVKPTQLVENNRLARLYQLISTNTSDKLDGFILNNGPQNVLTYTGGPNAVLGVGKTNIRYSSFRTGKQNPLFSSGPGSANYSYFTGSYFTGSNGSRTPVFLSERQDIPSYINSFSGSVRWTGLRDTNNTYNNFLLSRDDFKVLSPFVKNNNLVTSVIPESQRTPDSFYVKSVSGSYLKGKQVGGLQINPNKSWIKAIGSILPDSNINSPQSSSFYSVNSPLYNSKYTNNKKENISGSVDGGKYSFYNPLFNEGISSKESIYNKLLSVFETENQKRAENGNPTWYNNVYKPGTLKVNSEAIGPNTWTPPQNERDNPYGINYRIGTDTSINYDINNSKGVTNTSLVFTDLTLGASEFTFQNPSVYKPVVKGEPLLEPNTNKTEANNTFTYSPKEIAKPFEDETKITGRLKGSPSIQDFRKVLRATLSGSQLETAQSHSATPISPDYVTQDIGNKNLIGNPGAFKGKNLVSYTAGSGLGPVDKINATPINGDIPGGKHDLVTFNIADLGGGNVLHFRAFLNSFNDTFTSKINGQQMVGRGEEFYTYGGFSRKISLSWTVAALSREELLPMYKKLSYLASNTAPVYGENGFMKGPLVQLTVGGYIKNMPGYIDNISLELLNESPWEIAIDDDGNLSGNISQLSQTVKVSSFSFIPIPNYLPERGARFIELWNGPGSKQLW